MSVLMKLLSRGELYTILTNKEAHGAYSGACPFNLEPVFFEFQIETFPL